MGYFESFKWFIERIGSLDLSIHNYFWMIHSENELLRVVSLVSFFFIYSLKGLAHNVFLNDLLKESAH